GADTRPTQARGTALPVLRDSPPGCRTVLRGKAAGHRHPFVPLWSPETECKSLAMRGVHLPPPLPRSADSIRYVSQGEPPLRRGGDNRPRFRRHPLSEREPDKTRECGAAARREFVHAPSAGRNRGTAAAESRSDSRLPESSGNRCSAGPSSPASLSESSDRRWAEGE